VETSPGSRSRSPITSAPGDADALLKDLAASNATTIEVLPSPLKTAKAIGVTVLASILTRADEIIS